MKKVSSVVWQFFDRLEENKRCVAVLCKLCDTEYKYFGNTTNLRAHLVKKHPIQWEFRQNNLDGQKSVGETVIRAYEDDESNQSAISTKRRKYVRTPKDNVRYSLSIRKPGSTGGDGIPKIEIQRVDVPDNSETENELAEAEEDETTVNLVRQMHDVQATDEEWLEEDYVQLGLFDPKKKRKTVQRKIKRELVTPPRQWKATYTPHSDTRRNRIIQTVQKDEYSVFGEYIANKLRKFKAPRTRGNIQQLITTILWQAEYGHYDDADSVKKVLLSTVEHNELRQTVEENDLHSEEYTIHVTEKNIEEANQIAESGTNLME